jgi:hypothetical protein
MKLRHPRARPTTWKRRRTLELGPRAACPLELLAADWDAVHAHVALRREFASRVFTPHLVHLGCAQAGCPSVLRAAHEVLVGRPHFSPFGRPKRPLKEEGVSKFRRARF